MGGITSSAKKRLNENLDHDTVLYRDPDSRKEHVATRVDSPFGKFCKMLDSSKAFQRKIIKRTLKLGYESDSSSDSDDDDDAEPELFDMVYIDPGFGSGTDYGEDEVSVIPPGKQAENWEMNNLESGLKPALDGEVLDSKAELSEEESDSGETLLIVENPFLYDAYKVFTHLQGLENSVLRKVKEKLNDPSLTKEDVLKMFSESLESRMELEILKEKYLAESNELILALQYEVDENLHDQTQGVVRLFEHMEEKRLSLIETLL